MISSVCRTSISIPKYLKEKLNKYSNKSRVIVDALSLYFEKEKYLQEAEKEYWEKVKKSLEKGDGEYISINPNNEKITHNILEKTLWK